MGLPAALVVAIEGIGVPFGDPGPAVRVVSVRPSSIPPETMHSVTITVEAVQDGASRYATARIAAQDLANHAFVVEFVGQALRRELIIPRPGVGFRSDMTGVEPHSAPA